MTRSGSIIALPSPPIGVRVGVAVKVGVGDAAATFTARGAELDIAGGGLDTAGLEPADGALLPLGLEELRRAIETIGVWHGRLIEPDAHWDRLLASLRALAVLVCDLSGAKLGFLSDGANSAGACLAGVLPHRGPAGQAVATAGMTAHAMCESPLKGYLLFGVEPEHDCWDSEAAMTAMDSADFVVSFSPWASETMKDSADVLLVGGPISVPPYTGYDMVNYSDYYYTLMDDGDELPDILVALDGPMLKVYSGLDGGVLWSHEFDAQIAQDHHPTIWDLDGDGELDVFTGANAGLVVAEVELATEDESFELPPWSGDEVSGDPRYYNVNLVKEPYCRWR